jgi:deoxyhypusine synthase
MIEDKDCTTMLCIAGSTGGCMQVYLDLVRHNMVDVIVAIGAAIVDMDFFDALGFRHCRGCSVADDKELRELYIDRIYDTYIDEEQLRICDSTTKEIADSLEPRGQRRWGKIFDPVPAGEPR